MSTIVAGICASHHTGMNWAVDRTKDQAAVKVFQDGIVQAGEILHAARPDAAVVIGSNHFQGTSLESMPAFLIGVGEVTSEGEGGTPKGELVVDTELGRRVAWGLTERHFDLSVSARMEVDHGVTIVVQHMWPTLDLPLVPIVVNTFAAPLPTWSRCREFGVALREAIENDGEDKRVAIIASGGLSHNLPFFPKWYSTKSAEEDGFVEVGMYPRDAEGNVAWGKTRGAVLNRSTPIVNPEFDKQMLADILARDWDNLLAHDDATLDAIAGNGSQEIRNWYIAAAAVEAAGGKELAYSPIVEWHAGMAVASLM